MQLPGQTRHPAGSTYVVVLEIGTSAGAGRTSHAVHVERVDVTPSRALWRVADIQDADEARALANGYWSLLQGGAAKP
ncbi:hypothetical protein [Saccharothrix hoggarensis]|uniref:Uncharacterized protein n=1 Tax=Saccharothrix hoggarensis TaxID=913853 RepID=A0ABW3QFS7_9PSEU